MKMGWHERISFVADDTDLMNVLWPYFVAFELQQFVTGLV
jgi:hypothetical protein